MCFIISNKNTKFESSKLIENKGKRCSLDVSDFDGEYLKPEFHEILGPVEIFKVREIEFDDVSVMREKLHLREVEIAFVTTISEARHSVHAENIWKC